MTSTLFDDVKMIERFPFAAAANRSRDQRANDQFSRRALHNDGRSAAEVSRGLQ